MAKPSQFKCRGPAAEQNSVRAGQRTRKQEAPFNYVVVLNGTSPCCWRVAWRKAKSGGGEGGWWLVLCLFNSTPKSVIPAIFQTRTENSVEKKENGDKHERKDVCTPFSNTSMNMFYLFHRQQTNEVHPDYIHCFLLLHARVHFPVLGDNSFVCQCNGFTSLQFYLS